MRKLKDISYILDYVFGRSIHDSIDLGQIKFLVSKKTGKVKQLYCDDGRLIGTLRSDGSLAPAPSFYHLASKSPVFEQNAVVVKEDAVAHIRRGSSVFVQNVKKIGKNVSVGSDVFILAPNKDLIGIGKSTVSAKQIERFKSGLCVKNRVIKG